MEYARYMAFAFADFYPAGGLADCDASFESKEDAMQWLGSKGYEHDTAYIFDRIEGRVISQVE